MFSSLPLLSEQVDDAHAIVKIPARSSASKPPACISNRELVYKNYEAYVIRIMKIIITAPCIWYEVL